MKRLIVPIIATFVILASAAAYLSHVRSAQTPAVSIEVSLDFQRTKPPVLLGEVRFNDDQGNPMTLAEKRGRVVLMNFWATWCSPCVREMPSLKRLQAKFDKSVFEVMLISEDRDPSVIEPFYKEHGLTDMAIYHDPRSRLTRQFAIPGLPTTLLIDHKGFEVGRVVGSAEWDSQEALALIRGYTGSSALKAAEN